MPITYNICGYDLHNMPNYDNHNISDYDIQNMLSSGQKTQSS